MPVWARRERASAITAGQPPLPPFPLVPPSPCRPTPPLSPVSLLAPHATHRLVSSGAGSGAAPREHGKGGSGDEDAVEGVLDRGLLPSALLLLLRRPHGRPSLSLSLPLFLFRGGPQRGFGSGVGISVGARCRGLQLPRFQPTELGCFARRHLGFPRNRGMRPVVYRFCSCPL